MKTGETSAWDVIEALDCQRSVLEQRNEELVEQLADMNVALNNPENRLESDCYWPYWVRV
jgi:hypothetical protein